MDLLMVVIKTQVLRLTDENEYIKKRRENFFSLLYGTLENKIGIESLNVSREHHKPCSSYKQSKYIFFNEQKILNYTLFFKAIISYSIKKQPSARFGTIYTFKLTCLLLLWKAL